MGQKTHPYGFRLGYNKPFKSRWYADKDYADLLHEDVKLRKELKEKLKSAGISSIDIERAANKLVVRIYTARPGIIIGRKGAEIDKLKQDVQKRTKREVHIDIQEVHRPELDATLVAESIALQLEKRVAFRRAMRKAVDSALRFGFRHVGCHAFRSRHVMFGHAYPQVRGALLVAKRPAHRRGAQPLPARPFIHKALRHEQLIHIQGRSRVVRLTLGIGDCAAQHLFDVFGRALRRVLQCLQSVLRFLPADQIHHQPRFLRRHSYVPRQRVRFNQYMLCLRVSHKLCLRRRGCCRWRCAASCWCRAG